MEPSQLAMFASPPSNKRSSSFKHDLGLQSVEEVADVSDDSVNEDPFMDLNINEKTLAQNKENKGINGPVKSQVSLVER